MKTIDSAVNQGVMPSLRNRKGFSLVEMAIVLVIIGIIIGAVMKGQDLITNARAKQVITAANTWKALTYAFLDRNGRLPGDLGRTGVFGNYTGTNGPNAEVTATMANAPSNPVTIGSLNFYMYLGVVPGDPNGTQRNVLILCNKIDCSATFTADEIEIIKSIDTAEDGFADATKGQFRGVVSALNPQISGGNTLTALTGFSNYSAASNISTPWTAGTFKAAVWAFDRPF